ncbi:uncharacterized protein LOC119266839 [Triticum dicoccoides]|nr:uncharacterized protein LOC119266839 [Triticum dicoccoides]XP_037404016.1 uncharacterized protein LOC119266839 [Triticum dicoccoides]XP_044404474.1 uncharacterized protein LOC123128514 isoform X2 [Triticum aestivum]XP_044404475.1 uncharacterized protein LOC123128514 isoform X2 [Triticum aestivum]XP_044404476.1 uncharacterized protein LOC123128514 isoform X2 [Triticum aestivum]
MPGRRPSSLKLKAAKRWLRWCCSSAECRQLNDSARAIKVASQTEEGATAENIVQPASVLNVGEETESASAEDPKNMLPDPSKTKRQCRQGSWRTKESEAVVLPWSTSSMPLSRYVHTVSSIFCLLIKRSLRWKGIMLTI